MNQILVILIDLAAVSILTFGLYFPRHRRRDLVVAYLGVNVGVLAVASVLSSSTISFGLGLGLFGVLSIIRLRSYEIDQHEIAYYFASLAIGLLAGLTPTPSFLTVALIVLVIAVLFVGDNPKLFKNYRQQILIVGQVFPTEVELEAHLAKLLNAKIRNFTIKRVDLVNDSTMVDVRYQVA